MIRSVRIRGFKRFRDAEFRLPGHAVLTGPNDTGKTTLLQAIASWALALRRWRELGDFGRRFPAHAGTDWIMVGLGGTSGGGRGLG